MFGESREQDKNGVRNQLIMVIQSVGADWSLAQNS